MLESFGLNVIEHPLQDHAPLSPGDLDFGDAHEVLMTEKDAVKLPVNDNPHWWSVPVSLAMDDDAANALIDSIDAACRKRKETH